MPVILATQEADQEDCGSKPARTNSYATLSQKYLTEKGLVEWLKV
jgi:hypothetical protein